MSTLEKMSQFTISELSDFTINELDAMSYETLLAAVRGKYALAKEVCREDAPLTDAQIKMVKQLMQDNDPETTFASSHPWIFSVAASIISASIINLPHTIVQNQDFILDKLKIAYQLLQQLILYARNIP